MTHAYEMDEYFDDKRVRSLRGFLSTLVRDNILYHGGVYRMPALLGNDGDKASALKYCKRVFNARLATENKLAHTRHDPQMEICSLYVWIVDQYYTEFVTLGLQWR